MFTAVDDVAREAAKAQRELAAKVKKRAEKDQEDAKNEEHSLYANSGVCSSFLDQEDAKNEEHTPEFA